MDNLIVLIPLLGCAAMMIGCAAMMWGGHRFASNRGKSEDTHDEVEHSRGGT